MPPRRKPLSDATSQSSNTASSTTTSKSSTSTASSTRSGRPSRATAASKRVVQPPSSDEDEDDDAEEEAEEDVKPKITRGGRSSAGSAASGRGKKVPVPAKKKGTTTAGRGRRSATDSASVASEPVVGEEEEEEEDQDASEMGGTPELEQVDRKPVIESEGSDEEQDEDEDDESEEEVVKAPVKGRRGKAAPAPRAKAAPLAKKGKKGRVVDSEEEDEPVASEGEAEEDEDTTPSAAQKRKAPLPDPNETPAASDVDSNASEDEEAVVKRLPLPLPNPATTSPTANTTLGTLDSPLPASQPSASSSSTAAPAPPTAHDLASAARLAALNHAKFEKEREKELAGKPRLVIHQLVLEDFKSYKGRGVIGPFHKSFSSIVGPNGSGKSNTIDALLFVFGYRATKMRQGKLSELIHNSGPSTSSPATESGAADATAGGEWDSDAEGEEDLEDEYSKGAKGKKGKKGKGKKTAQEVDMGGIQSCTVEVWFREIIDTPGSRDEFTVVPNSQLIVARTAYRNNSSKYTINGKTSTYSDAQALLKGKGIDLDHNRFLILQGEVESIAQMKPKGLTEHDEGLLEYLEDIIGTARYKKEIEGALEEVEKLNEARGVQLNRVKLVEREKAALEGRKKEADAYLKDQNELAHNQSALYQVYIHQASLNSGQYQIAVDEAKEELQTEVDSQAGTRTEVQDLQSEYDQLDADTKTVEKATNEIVKELMTLEKSDVQNQEKKKSLANKLKKLKKSLTDDTHAKSEATTWVRNHGEEIERVRGELGKMESNMEKEEAELERVRDSLKGKTEVFTAQIEALQKELQPWAEQISEKQNEIDLAANERDLLKEKSEGVQAAVEEVQANLEKLAEEDVAKNERMDELVAEKKTVESQIKTMQAKLDGTQAEDAKLRGRATAARQKSDEMKASQTANRSKGEVLSSLTKLKDQGRLPGFHGRLGDLGRIDDKYDIAVSTACPGLDNLVTDTISVGQACIEHLRKHELGRANVMCLDRVAARDMSRIATPENAPRLFDLITPKDPTFAPAFYQLLTNTLVATDLDQGKRLAFGSGNKRWRVVTLDGQLIDTSGTMSGGGGRPSKGRMSSKIVADDVSPEMVAKCEQEQKVAVEALRVFVEDRQHIENDLAQLKKRMPEIDMSMSKLKMDISTSKKRVDEAERRLAELKSQAKPEAGDVKKIAGIEKTIASLTTELNQLRKQSSSIEDKIKGLQEKILEVGGVKLRTQQAKVQDLNAQINSATDRLTKAEVRQAKSEKDAIKLEKAIDSHTAAIELIQIELDQILTQIAGGAKQADDVRKSVEEAQDILAAKKEELAEIKSALDEKVDIMTQFKKRELELTQQLAGHQKLLDEALKGVTHWSEMLGELQLNELDDSDDEDESQEPAAERPQKLGTDLRQWSEEEIADLDVKVLKAKISALEERIGKSTLDLSVLKEYARREKEFLQRAADLDSVTKDRDGAKKLADDLRSQRLKEFMEGFGIISMKLKEMYQMITLGGNAELELVDSLDPFSEGIIFSVMPPKKSWKNISNLSGGEKTLSSLALVFALHVFKPTPLYFMDEIDAALDFRNVSIVANYIKDRTKNAQFIIISLRNNMFELSSRLIGIYKVANQTRSVAIDNNDLQEIQAT